MKIDPEKYKDLRKSRPWDFTDDKEILVDDLAFDFDTIQEAEDLINNNDIWILIQAYIGVASMTNNTKLEKELDKQFSKELSEYFNE